MTTDQCDPQGPGPSHLGANQGAPPADTLAELDALLVEAKDAIRVASVPYSTVASQQLWEASETLTAARDIVARLRGATP